MTCAPPRCPFVAAGFGNNGGSPKPDHHSKDAKDDTKSSGSGSGGGGSGGGGDDKPPEFNLNNALPLGLIGVFLTYLMLKPEPLREDISWQDVRNQFLAKGMVRRPCFALYTRVRVVVCCSIPLEVRCSIDRLCFLASW